jgi:hypothetical protein
MKKKFLLFILLNAIITVNAQESKAYLGISFGCSIPGGDGSENINSGLNVGFINFGYRFNKSWGATFNYTSSGFSLNVVDDGTIGITSFSAGPMFTVGLSDKLYFDVNPQYAFVSKAVINIPNGSATFNGTGFGLGSSLNFGISKGFKLSINIDYFSYKFKDTDAAFFSQTSTLSYNNANQLILGTGLRYNFK